MEKSGILKRSLYGQNLCPGPNKPPVSGAAHMRSHMFKRDQHRDLLLNVGIKSVSAPANGETEE